VPTASIITHAPTPTTSDIDVFIPAEETPAPSHKPTREPSLKRIDCRVSGESQCKDRCVWKGEEDKCLLHVPTNFDVGSQQVPATRLLVRKLIEELVRFPNKRNELLKQDVGHM
jgi:hypothetical protein